MTAGSLFGSFILLFVALVGAFLGVANLAHRRQQTVSGKVIGAAIVALLSVGFWLMSQGELFGRLPETVVAWVTVAAYLSAALFLLVVLDALVIGEYLIERRRRYIPDVIRTLLIGAELVVVLLVVLRVVMDIDVLALVALPTVAAAVVGVALKDTFARFFAGVELGKVIKVGDWINTMEKEGRVVHIGMEHVTLATLEQDYVTLPNDAMIHAGIANYSRPSTTHVCVIDVEATYQTSPLQVCFVLVEAAAAVEGVLPDPKPEALVGSFNESGIQYRLRFSIGDYARHQTISSTVRSYVWNAFHRHGIEIPLPQRVLHQPSTPLPATAVPAPSHIASRLGAIDLFAVLSPEQLELLIADAAVQDYLPGERIVREGEPGEDLYVILKGRAEVRIRHDALESTVATMEEGEFFGEMSLLTGACRSATVVAASHLQLLALGRHAITHLLEQDDVLIERIGAVVAERQGRTEAVREQLGRESASMAMDRQRRSLVERMQIYLWGKPKG